MYQYIPQFPKTQVYKSSPTTQWYYLQSPPPDSGNKFVYPGEEGRRMWLLLPVNVAEMLLKNGWTEVK